ncbi:adenosine deaminase [Roseibium marinum]|uniref:Adenosine deaminase n=1 Tax=Roseibium marinum TaxID=281252 RepID=A0A2S3UTG2_9HYPH|nr:adenosine deaminase [Roseibium marinum]POF30850.1 adenosine deaminase [Roseibium marinum]
MDVSRLIRKLPKAEIHIHLEGAIRPDTAMELAAKNGVGLPDCERVADLYSYDNLLDFLAVYGAIADSIVTVDDFRRITYEMLASAADNNCRYMEFFISPHAHKGVPFARQFEGIRAGMAEAETDFGILSRIIPGMNRELGPAAGEHYLDEILANRGDDLIGLGLDYNEAPFPPEPYAGVFARARKAGLRLTAHAGESGAAAFIAGSLDALKVERIDHGYNIVDDPALIARCRDEGIAFTCCPSTTKYTTSWRDLADPDHPIRRMKAAGLAVTINSDDPPMFATDLGREFELAHSELGFTLQDLRTAILASLEAAWLDDTTRRAWTSAWAREIDDIIPAG